MGEAQAAAQSYPCLLSVTGQVTLCRWCYSCQPTMNWLAWSHFASSKERSPAALPPGKLQSGACTSLRGLRPQCTANQKGKHLYFILDHLPPAIKNKLPFSSYLPSSVYVNFVSCYCGNSRDGGMLLISFFRKVFFSKQLVLNRTKQPRNSMLISQISSNVRALYIVLALAEMKFDYVNVSQPFNLTQRHFHYRFPGH